MKATLAAVIAAVALTGVSVAAPTAGKHKFTLGGTGLTLQEDEWAGAEFELTSADTEGRYSLLESTWKPGFKAPPHFHKTHAETFHVISGQVEWTVGGETHVMNAGDTVFIPPNTIHSVKVVGTVPVKMMMLYDPGGYEDVILREQKYTKAQRDDPAIKAELRRQSDFNPVE